jgi:2'-5' RNA ligase
MPMVVRRRQASSMIIRTFIAVPIPETPPLEGLRKELGELRPAMKLIAGHQQHVTLAFLGDTNESLIPRLIRILQEVARTEDPAERCLYGLGAFPRAANPSVVWVGFADPKPLIRMASSLVTRCETLGFPRESRPYHPHLTIARVKATPPDSLPQWIRDHAHTDFGRVSLSQLDLFRSDLLPVGPVYTSLASIPLGRTQ